MQGVYTESFHSIEARVFNMQWGWGVCLYDTHTAKLQIPV